MPLSSMIAWLRGPTSVKRDRIGQFEEEADIDRPLCSFRAHVSEPVQHLGKEPTIAAGKFDECFPGAVPALSSSHMVKAY